VFQLQQSPYIARPKNVDTMEYKRIVAVTGLPGLFEVVSTKSDGAIVRPLEDKSTKFIASRVHNLSHLESIEIFTKEDNVNLVDVFNAMRESTEALPDVKDNKALKAYFENVYGDIDFERVYTSDMKKIVKWYEVLKSNNVEIKLSPEEDSEEETGEDKDLAQAEETVTLEVSGDDTAETAKAKTKRKKKEEKEN
jgi:hypothetical protein